LLLASSIYVKHTMVSNPTSTIFVTCFGWRRKEVEVAPMWLMAAIWTCGKGSGRSTYTALGRPH
jgi:hypothetical protein